MEFEFNDRSAITEEVARTEPPIPSDATYYQALPVDDDIHVLSIDSLIINDNVKIAYNQLKNTFGSQQYNANDIRKEAITQLDPKLRELFDLFKSNKPILPIEVRTLVSISNPSPNYPDVPSQVGIGAPMVQYEISTDYLYQLINGEKRVALSIFFGYNYIPVVTRV